MRLVSDWVGYVLQWVQLQGRDPFKVMRMEVGVGEDFGGLQKLTGGYFKEIVHGDEGHSIG